MYVSKENERNGMNYYCFFFFRESFNLWRPLLIIDIYHQTKTSISFRCRRGLNPKSLIQPLETLAVELAGTHRMKWNGIK